MRHYLGQKEGHKSYDCPEGGGGNKSGKRFQLNLFEKTRLSLLGGGGGGCFKCGKDGHKSFECPDSRKPGGRDQSGKLLVNKNI
jgi:probable ATP-dependent RNA helicase DDX4